MGDVFRDQRFPARFEADMKSLAFDREIGWRFLGWVQQEKAKVQSSFFVGYIRIENRLSIQPNWTIPEGLIP